MKLLSAVQGGTAMKFALLPPVPALPVVPAAPVVPALPVVPAAPADEPPIPGLPLPLLSVQPPAARPATRTAPASRTARTINMAATISARGLRASDGGRPGRPPAARARRSPRAG